MDAPGITQIPIKAARAQKVYWNWDIVYSCNYRCSYCFFAKNWENDASRNRYPSLEKLLATWDRIYDLYGSCHIHFAGGEPFIYPNFITFLEALAPRHTLGVTTNLSWDIQEIIGRVPPDKIKLETSFHLEFAKFEEFRRKCFILKEHGYHIGITMVAAPLHMKRYIEYRNILKPDFGTNLVPLRGKAYGKMYPDAYTDEEKAMLKAAVINPKALEPARKEEPKPAAQAPTEPAAAPEAKEPSQKYYEWHVEKESEKLPETRMCMMGVYYGKVRPNGDVLRCCTPDVEEIVKIGNIFDEDFRLLDGPTPCSIKQCGCWKAMLEGQEDKWKPFWT